MNTHLDCPSPACDLLLSDRAICYGGSSGFIILSVHQNGHAAPGCASQSRFLAAGRPFCGEAQPL